MDFSCQSNLEMMYYVIILHQTIQNLIFEMAIGSHFEFRALQSCAQRFSRYIPAKFFIYLLKMSKPLRNGVRRLTVTKVVYLPQLNNQQNQNNT